MLTVLDLFSGIGGFSLGLERTGGFKTIAFCEIDNYCQRVLKKHWPEVYIHSDIRTLTAKQWHHFGYRKPDVIVGGFPCQDISVAGKGIGLEGARSGLWREMFRLVCALRPKYLIVENVAALLARGLGTVLGDLASIGYDAEWECIPASAIGAPHRRDRVWIVADPDITRLEGWERGQLQECTSEQLVGASGALADAIFEQRHGRLYWTCGWQREPQEALPDARRVGGQENGLSIPQSDLGRVAYGIPHRVDRLRSLGNSIVPQIATWIGERILAAERGE